MIIVAVVVAVVIYDSYIEHLCLKTLRVIVDKFAHLILKVCTGSGHMQSRLNAR